MTHSPIIHVLADDLTGAAEIAAIGHRLGRRAAVKFAGGKAEEREGSFTVTTTETRLAPPERAARIAADAAHRLSQRSSGLIFKKVDSVLRGSVAAEVMAIAQALGKRTVLIVPNNPGQGRVIRGGRYLIDGVPLDATDFRADPHHPATSSNVAELIGEASVVFTLKDVNFPSGIVIGEAGNAADLAAWAGRIDDTILPAGGAEFFMALTVAAGWVKVGPVPQEIGIDGPTLWICGTTAPSRTAALQRARSLGATLLSISISLGADQELACFDEVEAALTCAPLVALMIDGPVGQHPDGAVPIREVLARTACAMIQRGACRHLMLEGGATAASVLTALGWDFLTVVHEWAPGTVTLSPTAQPDARVTLKPGSYTWPESLWRAVVAKN
ncbi:MAG: hypothetical protein JWM32_2427 [Verrucomicrobia bacterium]|nr:hypothetical protein [Verrucomicrobiota bacterium]